MKKKIYASPSCEAIPFADEVLLAAATDPKDPKNKKEDENPSDTPPSIVKPVIPIDNSGKVIDNPNDIF